MQSIDIADLMQVWKRDSNTALIVSLIHQSSINSANLTPEARLDITSAILALSLKYPARSFSDFECLLYWLTGNIPYAPIKDRYKIPDDLLSKLIKYHAPKTVIEYQLIISAIRKFSLFSSFLQNRAIKWIQDYKD